MALRRLSVFAGGFTLEAAEAVCTDPTEAGEEAAGLDRWYVVDLVTNLVDRSLVQLEDDEEDEPRYRLLETIRQYARQKLLDAGEATEIHQRHALHFAGLADTAAPGLLSRDAARWRRTLFRELDNLRVADDWAAEAGQADVALRFGPREFWFHGHPGEGLTRLSRALALPGGTPVLRARALVAAAECTWSLGDFEAMARCGEEGMRIAEHVGDRSCRGGMLSLLGWAGFPQGDEGARAHLEAALDDLRIDGSPHWIADTHFGLGLIGMYAGEPETTRSNLTEAMSLGRARGNPAVGRSMAMLAQELVFEGEFDAAEAMVTEAGPLLACAADMFLSFVDCGRSWIAGSRGDHGLAHTVAASALAEARRAEQGFNTAWALWIGLLAELRSGQPADPLAGLDPAEAAMEAEGMPWGVAWCRSIRAEHLLATGDPMLARRCAEAAVALTDSTIYAGRARGRARLALARVERAGGDPTRAEDLAHQALAAATAAAVRPGVVEVLELLGGLAADGDSVTEAARLFAAAAATRDQLGYPIPPVESAAVERDRARARRGLEPAAFEVAWAEGAAMTLDEAVAYASRGRGERKRPATGWAALTPAETDVVRLAAEGLRNAEIAERLFVSVATVKTHLVHAFAKLGVSSRAELTAAVVRRTGGPARQAPPLGASAWSRRLVGGGRNVGG